ncbi:MAG: hypothetical protein JWR87_3406 [Segetibacter sp.]|jgi:hypothetical protein|nr:hypothetical protein [Segetibacter sp.]
MLFELEIIKMPAIFKAGILFLFIRSNSKLHQKLIRFNLKHTCFYCSLYFEQPY